MADREVIREREVETGAMGWFAALIVILAVVIGGIIWYQQGTPGIPNTGDQTDINITVPNPTTGSGTGGSGDGGASGGGATGGTDGTIQY
jgi:hypothetical protein